MVVDGIVFLMVIWDKKFFYYFLRPREYQFHFSILDYCIQKDSFKLCNAPMAFQHCMMYKFSNILKDTIEVFMDDLLVVDHLFKSFMVHLGNMLQRYEETKLVLN